MDLLYRTLIYLHVLSAIASIGPFFILLPMVKKLRTAEDSKMKTYLETFRFVVWLSKHSGHVLVVSGVLLVLSGPWNWSTPWILATLVILFSSLFFLARAFSATIRQFTEPGHNQATLASKLERTTWIYIGLLLLMLWFMVVKPPLW
ncbi:DUF2269 family protein [Mesobacillus harenae]|uniref:DUF2269 family protein n=1 Tax=Mesobacillus harenae TaxID=2213203 RepID=UPI001580E62F|nr:DUF2269 family protein [Mesobacillus harenae]